MKFPIRGVLIDVSGTVHVGDKAIPGAVGALDRLRASGIPFRFCTNTTQTSGEALATKLRELGFNVKREELVMSRGLRPLLFLEPDALQEFKEISQSEPHDSVVIGLSPSNFHYDMMNKAFKILVQTPQPGTLIAVHKARYFADKSHENLSLGPGGFVEALEYASGTKAHVVGKPQKAFFELAIQNMGLTDSTTASGSAEQIQTEQNGSSGIVMIGDDVEQDLGGGASELGLIRYLVQTGKYRAKDEDRDAFGGLDGTFKDFAAAVDHIVSNMKK
ncbi:Haloacid dehalogenase-like hydrolase domain-containing protein 2 [Haplosporangium sp. Z 767]|nr:Haloacid dehalogenase-like hydrolase domain-containing protein 2 [Haplosporangium sp. Z 11]KAF9193601.1 Haloacid dehalogenase-like hydrolase domain-containing protein 2 [Haplosporangium sp. Z 767]